MSTVKAMAGVTGTGWCDWHWLTCRELQQWSCCCCCSGKEGIIQGDPSNRGGVDALQRAALQTRPGLLPQEAPVMIAEKLKLFISFLTNKTAYHAGRTTSSHEGKADFMAHHWSDAR